MTADFMVKKDDGFDENEIARRCRCWEGGGWNGIRVEWDSRCVENGIKRMVLWYGMVDGIELVLDVGWN